MQYLFSKSGLQLLESLSFTRTLYAFDFDGTLAKIVRVPSEAGMSQKTIKLFNTLTPLVPVAIVSGRSIQDLAARASEVNPLYVVGNHGLEMLGRKNFPLQSAMKSCRGWKDSLTREKFGPGVDIEDKVYSLSVHYRRSRHKKIVVPRIKAAIDCLSPRPRILSGKSVINILSDDSPHKGLAVLELAEKIKANHVFYIGDDETDEDVFSMPGDFITSVRVGQKKNSQARFFIRRQAEINQVLSLFVRFLSRHSIEKVAK